MSISAIASNNLLNQSNSLPNTNQQQRTEFQQLTQALQSGNLTNARQAFGALTSKATNSGVLSVQLKQELSKLGSALQSGNLTSARQAYSSVQQDLQNPNPVTAHHHRPHHGLSHVLTSGFPDSTGSSGGSAAGPSDVSQALSLTA
jgi:hypothetical protein